MSSQQQSVECWQSVAACSRKLRSEDLTRTGFEASVLDNIENTIWFPSIDFNEEEEDSQASSWENGPKYVWVLDSLTADRKGT